MVLSQSEILLACGVLVATAWLLTILTLSISMGLLCLFCKETRDGFREHISGCVVEGKCPLMDSRIHVAEERIAWSLMKRGGLLREIFGIWVFLFLLAALFPFEVGEIGIKKIN